MSGFLRKDSLFNRLDYYSNTTSVNNGSSVSTVTVPVYSAGNGIDISPSGVISNTAPAVSTTITSGGVVNVTPTGSNSYLIEK